MIVCPACGIKNSIPDTLNLEATYRCGKCGSVLITKPFIADGSENVLEKTAYSSQLYDDTNDGFTLVKIFLNKKAALIISTDFIIAATFLIVWISPTIFGDNTISSLSALLLIELVSIHSALFMMSLIYSRHPFVIRICGLLPIVIFYVFMAYMISYSFNSYWAFLGFCGLMVRRIVIFTLDKTQKKNIEFKPAFIRGFIQVAFLFIAISITLDTPLPELGVIPEYVQQIKEPGDPGGLWVDEPYRVLCSGLIYFLGLGLWHIYSQYRLLKGKTTIIKGFI